MGTEAPYPSISTMFFSMAKSHPPYVFRGPGGPGSHLQPLQDLLFDRWDLGPSRSLWETSSPQSSPRQKPWELEKLENPWLFQWEQKPSSDSWKRKNGKNLFFTIHPKMMIEH